MKLHLDAPNDPDSSWPDLQVFFDSFPQKHPFYHKVHISDFKIRAEPKSIRHPQYSYGAPNPDSDSVVVLSACASAAATAAVDTSIVRRVVREPVSSAQQKRNYRREMLSSRRRSLREMSYPTTMESEGDVCISPTWTAPIKVSSYQQGRINQIEEGSFLDNVTITDYVLKSNIIQTMLFYGKS